ncbi:Zinc finger protein 143 [Chionoecetes opilio]|uniref:Zinc finger protein 143 n=1 Tax=Chionoecetes opilio TaxID=41210 RepID=A0A8J4YFM7_CHIOP|nr:Zinc finger protein 143 [Chionoecetes opilio]
MEEGVVTIKGEVEDPMETSQHTSVVVVEEGRGAVTVELPDGTQAIVHNAITEEPQDDMEGVAIQLDDGRIGYICGDTLLQAMSEGQDAMLPGPKFVCRFQNCDKSYSSVHHLKTHQRNHTGQRPHICHTCKKRFTTGYALKSHLRTHTGEKPYKCPEELCPKSFKTSGDLQKHVRTHTGERPFKCEVCEKSFTTSNIRKVHMRVHTGEKPYECQYEGCGRRFASATNYRNHCRIHTGEKPYVCSVQAGVELMFYRQMSTLLVHKRSVHNIIDSEEGQMLWMPAGLDILAEDQDGNEVSLQEGTTLLPAASTSTPRAIHLPSGMVVKKQDQSGIMGGLRGCLRTTQCNLDWTHNGSIFVFTDPTNLATLQLAVAGSAECETGLGDTVEVIRLDDFTSVAESTITEDVPETTTLKQDLCARKGKLIIVKEVGLKEGKSSH